MQARRAHIQVPTRGNIFNSIFLFQQTEIEDKSFRGLPPGYLANVEERLAETENALLHALSIIHASEVGPIHTQQHLGVSTAPNERPRELEFNEVRIAKVEEWQKLPLHTQEQQRHWMRHKLATDEISTAPDPINGQQETIDLTSRSQKRQRNREIESASKRRRPTSASNGTLDLGEDHGLMPTTPTVRAATGPQSLAREDTQTADTVHPDTLSPYIETAASNLQHQHANIRSPARHFTSSPPQARTSEPPGPRPEIQPEQSKAKRLASLHSRRYF